MFVERLGSYRRDTFFKLAVLAVGRWPMLIWFLDGKEVILAYILYLKKPYKMEF